MKSLQNQYNDIKKRKGSKDVFLKEAKRLYPQIIPNHTNFNDAVKLLTAKNIISRKMQLNEQLGGIVSTPTFKEPNFFKTFQKSLNEEFSNVQVGATVKIPIDLTTDPINKQGEEGKVIFITKAGDVVVEFEDGKVGTYQSDVFRMGDDALNEYGEDSGGQDMNWGMYNKKSSSKNNGNQDFIKIGYEAYFDDVPFEACPYEKGPNKYYGGADLSELWKQGWKNAESEYEDDEREESKYNGYIESAWGGNSDVYENKSSMLSRKLNEAKKKKEGYDYSDKDNIDNVYGMQFLQGFYMEMNVPENENKSIADIKKIVAKNLKADANFYVKNGQFGIKGAGYVEATSSKTDQMEPVSKEKPKANVKAGKKENKKGTPKGVTMMKEALREINEMYDPEGDDGDRDFDIKTGIEADELYDKGLELYNQGHKEKAEEYRQKALKKGSWLSWGENEFPSYETINENDDFSGSDPKRGNMTKSTGFDWKPPVQKSKSIKKAIEISNDLPDAVEALGFEKMSDDRHYNLSGFERITPEIEAELDSAGFYVKDEVDEYDEDRGWMYYYNIELKENFINEITKLTNKILENNNEALEMANNYMEHYQEFINPKSVKYTEGEDGSFDLEFQIISPEGEIDENELIEYIEDLKNYRGPGQSFVKTYIERKMELDTENDPEDLWNVRISGGYDI